MARDSGNKATTALAAAIRFFSDLRAFPFMASSILRRQRRRTARGRVASAFASAGTSLVTGSIRHAANTISPISAGASFLPTNIAPLLLDFFEMTLDAIEQVFQLGRDLLL